MRFGRHLEKHGVRRKMKQCKLCGLPLTDFTDLEIQNHVKQNHSFFKGDSVIKQNI